MTKETHPTENLLPISTHQGSFVLFGVEVKCHRLSNGETIIEAESLDRLFEAMRYGEAKTLDYDEVLRYRKFLQGGHVV